MRLCSLNKHPKVDDINHPNLDDFSSLSSYIGNNHHKSSKIVKPTQKSIQFWMKQRENHPLLEVDHT